MEKKLHPRIQELRLRSAPISYTDVYKRSMSDDAADVSIDFKASASTTDRVIKCYLAVWGVEDTHGTIFIKGCCSKSIAERGPESQSKQKIAHLWMHDQTDPTGQYRILKEDDYGLYAEILIDEIPTGDRELTQVRSGTLNQFSIGFDYVWDKLEYDEDLDAVIVKEIILMEGSVVTFGSNCETYAMRSVEELATIKENLMHETEDFIKSVPRNKQLELRQLITRHISLATSKPLEIKKRALDLSLPEPVENVLKIGDYKLDVKQFN